MTLLTDTKEFKFEDNAVVVNTLDDLYSMWYFSKTNKDQMVLVNGIEFHYVNVLSTWYFVFGGVTITSNTDLVALSIISNLKIKPRVRISTSLLKGFDKVVGTRDRYAVLKDLFITVISVWEDYAIIEVN